MIHIYKNSCTLLQLSVELMWWCKTGQIFNEWMEKLQNMKMKGRFIDAMERLENPTTKKITTKTQNLRDKLLTHHMQE